MPFEPAFLSRYDAVVIVTDHDCIDYEVLLRFSRLIVDTRNRMVRVGGGEALRVVARA